MSNFQHIQQKLQQFSRKYYTNELIKGILLFVALGLLYFLFTLFIEYFLWLRPTARTILFWVFVIVELFLLVRFIGFPLFKLVGLQQGISSEDCSKIIGRHFPEVNDKLLNVLQLQRSTEQSDLLVASIEQKSNELQPIPFTKAVDFRTNTKYLKYALIPIVIWLLIFVFGKNTEFNNSFQRVVNHSTAYNPPAPFVLSVTNKHLNVIQGNPLTLYVEAKGEVIPEIAKIVYENQQYFLQNEGNGLFSYTFSEVTAPVRFYIKANEVRSQDYRVNVIKTPTIQSVSMRLLYPKYLKKANETIENTGNAIVPQGTVVQWHIKAIQTQAVSFINENKRRDFKQETSDRFMFSDKIMSNTNYKITASNSELKDYEALSFSLEIIKDEHPSITVQSNIDSISRGTAYFKGQITDDYGISKLELVYYDIKKPDKQYFKTISVTSDAMQPFFYEFPSTLSLQPGVDYEMFFQVFDNDAVLGAKKTTSRKFSYRQKTTNEIEEELLQEQRNHIENLENTIEKQQKTEQAFKKIQFNLQNKKNVNWNDQNQIQNLLKRQQQYKEMMQRQTEQLQENLDEKKEPTKSLQEKKEALKQRIEELKKIEKQEKLLKELMKVAEKLNKEELIKKAKELAQQNKQQERNLERVLEMTKRFYVEQKTNQIAEKLKELAKKQEELANKAASKQEQDALKKEFDQLQKELKELQKDNEKLKEPMDIPSLEELKRDTEKELNKAGENLEQQNQQGAKKHQKKAAKNMQQMSAKMQQAMQAMSMEMKQENMEDLRQILKNLITFSFDQEKLMSAFVGSDASNPNFGKHLRKQYQLKEYVEHIDDSLFALSIRVPKISSKIQEQLGNAHYNLNESLENFAENRFRNGVKNQRYVMTAANELADMLSNTLDAMSNPQPGSGSGKGQKGTSISLPDIIQKQSELLQKMQQGLNQQQGKEQQGKNKKGTSEQGEKLDGELYEIYKQQSELRKELEKVLEERKGGNGNAKKAVKDMKQLENQILEKGFNKATLNRMQKLNYELLKLDKATLEQGKDKKRTAKTNLQEFKGNNTKKLESEKRYYNQTEILNRQSLPLRQHYKKKVQEYFKKEE